MSYKIYHNCYSCRYECWMFSSKGIYVHMEFASGYTTIIFKEKKNKKTKKRNKKKTDLDITHRLWIQFQ